MSAHIAYRTFDLTDGKHCFGHGEVRYTFTVQPGRRAVTWANASSGFSPAEGASVTIGATDIRLHPKHDWFPADGTLADLLAEVTDDWFLEQVAEEQAA